MIYSKEQARLNLIAAVRLIDKYFALKYDPDQPRDEAGRWTDGGGGGESSGGGGISGKVEFREGVDEFYTNNDFIKPTTEQMDEFKGGIDELPNEVQSLMQGDYQPLTVVLVDEDYHGQNIGGNTIVLGKESLSIIGQHEFLHYVVSGGAIKENINYYKPSSLFAHARSAASPSREDLTMMLHDYSPDRNSWIINVMQTEPNITRDDAEYKIDYTSKFLKDSGLWK